MFITEKYFRARFSNVCNVVVKRCCLEREKCYEIGTTSKRFAEIRHRKSRGRRSIAGKFSLGASLLLITTLDILSFIP